MPTYSPTIIVNSNPAIQISMAGNITYAEFVAALGAFVYLINSVFVQASSFDQLRQTNQYTAFDASGYLFSEAIPMAPDPYQSLPAMQMTTPPFGMVLNGRSYINMNVNVGERVQWVLNCDEISLSKAMDVTDKSNLEWGREIDDNMGQLELFEQYNNFIE